MDRKMIVHDVSQALLKKEFSSLGPLAERHGSWEIIFCRKSDGLDRLISLGFTGAELEIRIGADDGQKFVSQRFLTILALSDDCNPRIRNFLLFALLDCAVDTTMAFTALDLNQTHQEVVSDRS